MDDEVKRLEELVKQGDADAMTRLGEMYQTGKGVLQNFEKAQELYEEATNLGNAGAMNNLGIMYYFGQGVSQDYSKAKERFEQSAILGCDIAMVNLGAMYEYGQAVLQDHGQAKKWYEEAYKAGNKNAKEHIDRINKKIEEERKNNNDKINYEDKTIEELEELVKQNDDKAIHELGLRYYDGKGVEKDYNEAYKWFEQSANLGDSESLYQLGYMNVKGFGVEPSYEKAVEYYKKAIELGNVKAMYNLAYIYQYALGGFDNIEEAIELYKKAANLGDAKSMYQLGNIYFEGDGVKSDYLEAFNWFEKSSELGNSDAMYMIANMYENGYGVKMNFGKALEYCKKASNLGNVKAKQNLDKLKKINEHVNPKGINYEDKSIEELEELVKQNDDKAMYELGIRYCDGRGVEKDIEKALDLFEHAIILENTSSMIKLGTMYFLGKDVSQDYKKSRQLFSDAKVKYEKLYQQNKDKYYLDNIKYIEMYIILVDAKVVDAIESSDKTDEEELPKDVISKPKVNEDVERLKRLVSDLSSKYVAREQTVRMLANNIYHGRKIMKSVKDSKTIRDNISTILLISSTGGGKTAIISDLAKEFDVPFTSVSLSAGYTQAGYVGLSLQDIFKKLINAADGDVEKAQEGIIILDEFDKIRTKEDAHDEEFKRALQQELLSYLEGREVQLDTKGGPTTFNTLKLTFILAGAFQDITEYDMNYSDEDIKEAISKGYESELLGRIEIYHYMRKYTKEEYINILNDSKISPLTNFIVSCSIHGKNVITSPYSPFIESVAEEAVKLDKGVRGLNSIFANILNWYLDDLIYGESDISLMESYETIKKKKGRGK